MRIIPFHRPSIQQEEINEVIDTLQSGWLTSGPKTSQFEQEFRHYVGARHALAVNSCTAGLHLALVGLGIGPGDEVITTPLTFCATVNTILHTGARAVLADIGPDGNIAPDRVAAQITERTRAILPVHFAGQPCDMEAIWNLAEKHSLFVVEDAAHAAGSVYRSMRIGGRPQGRDRDRSSDAVAFSFYATKNLTTGEGGMVTTENTALADKMKILCLHGISKDAWNRYSEQGSWFYQVQECGFKYNLTDLQSSIGIHQLRKQESFIARRTAIAERYYKAFSEMEELEVPPRCADGRHAWHLYALRLNLEKLSINRDDFILLLQDFGICCSVHFIPIPLHPAYQGHEAIRTSDCANALSLYPRLISLPLYPAMTDQEVEQVVRGVRRVVRLYRQRVFAGCLPSMAS